MTNKREELVKWVGGLQYPEDRQVLESHADDYVGDAIDEATALLVTEVESLRKQVNDLHDGLNHLFKEALQLRNENRRLKELEKNDGAQ